MLVVALSVLSKTSSGSLLILGIHCILKLGNDDRALHGSM